MTGSALRLEESRDGRCTSARRGNIYHVGGPGGEWWRDSPVIGTWRMTGSALRLEESRDGRWSRPGGKYYQLGRSRRGRARDTSLIQTRRIFQNGHFA